MLRFKRFLLLVPFFLSGGLLLYAQESGINRDKYRIKNNPDQRGY